MQDDIDLVALGEQGVMVEAAVSGHPALAGGVVERAVGEASALLASQILPARLLLRVSEGVRVADGDGASSMLGRSFAGAPRLFERGEALDLLEPILASWACAYLDQIWDVSIIVLFGAPLIGLVSLDDGAFSNGLGGVVPMRGGGRRVSGWRWRRWRARRRCSRP